MEFLLRVLWLSFLGVHGETTDCPMLQESQLGNTSMLSSEGLLAAALLAQSGVADVSLQILESHTVCLGQGAKRDRYRSVSLMVRYAEWSNGTEKTVQVEYQCSSGEWGFGNQTSVTSKPEGNLTTPLRTDCSLCIKPGRLGGVEVSAEEHCLCKRGVGWGWS